jgi:hypothetical protein
MNGVRKFKRNSLPKSYDETQKYKEPFRSIREALCEICEIGFRDNRHKSREGFEKTKLFQEKI